MIARRLLCSWGALPHVPAGLSIRGEWPCEIGPVQYDSQWCAEKTDVSWSDLADRQEQRSGGAAGLFANIVGDRRTHEERRRM